MKLYALERIIKIEATDEFKKELVKVAARKLRAQKAVATKLAKMQAFIEGLVVTHPPLTAEQLTELAIKAYNNHGPSRNAERAERWQSASPHSRPEFLERITVNYLRHQCSPYDDNLRKIAGKTGVDEGRVQLKKKILQAIATSYPWLQEECCRQELSTEVNASFFAGC